MLIRLLLVSFSLILSLLNTAHGSPLLELYGGFNPERPWAGRSADQGPSAAYFNPARISLSEQTTRLTYLVSTRRLEIQFEERPAGYDVPQSVYVGRRSVGGELLSLDNRPFATADLPHPRPTTQRVDQSEHYLIFGLSTPLIDDRVSLGLITTLKAGFLQTQRPFFPDERQQYFDDGLRFEFMGDRLESMMASIGLAIAVTSNITLGVGGTLLNHASSIPQIYIPDASDQERAQTTPVIEVEPTLAPHFGLLWSMGDNVELSSSVHLPSESRLKGEGRLRFWDFEYPEGQNRLNQPFDLVFLYEPLRTSLGVKFEHDIGLDTQLELYGDLLWAQWSRYLPRHGEQPDGWNDTLSGSFGMRLGLGEHGLGWGIHYQPTPIPEQTGRSNYVDNARIGTQVGWSWSLLGNGYAVNFGAALQAQRWLQRSHFKSENATEPVVDEFPEAVDARTLEALPESRGLQTNNIGFPGFSHGGWLHTVMLSVALVK